MNFSVPIASAVIGLIVLLFGRRLFWLAVAAVGFAAGFEIAPRLFNEPTPLLMLTIALVLGFIGALLAVFLQKIAIGIAGFLAGGKLATTLAAAFFVEHAHYSIVTFVIGGILGALLLLMLFDWALIFMSAVVGAHLIQRTVALPATGQTILFLVLAAVGVLVQAGMLRRATVA